MTCTQGVGESVKRGVELGLCIVPDADVPNALLGSGGKLDLEGKPQMSYPVEEVEDAIDFGTDLRWTQYKQEAWGSFCTVYIYLLWVQKMCASSCTKRRTRVRPVRAPIRPLVKVDK